MAQKRSLNIMLLTVISTAVLLVSALGATLIAFSVEPDRRFFAGSFVMGAADTVTIGGAPFISNERWILELPYDSIPEAIGSIPLYFPSGQ